MNQLTKHVYILEISVNLITYHIWDVICRVDRIATGEVRLFTTTSYTVYHMESDLYIPGNVIYTDSCSIKTSNGTGSQVIAGNTTQYGYLEGTGSAAQFNYIQGFTQISSTQIVVSDTSNGCLRLVDIVSGKTSQFAGQCTKRGYQDGYNQGIISSKSFRVVE